MAARPFTVRPAGPEDAAALSRLGPATFREAFGREFPPAFVDERMAVIYGYGRLVEDLANPVQSWFLAEAGGKAIGFLTLAASPAPSCVTGPAPLELSRLYVREAWHGRGPAFALMEAGLEAARRRPARTLWLQAWERNPKALAFYRAHGFREAGRVVVAFGGAELPHLVLVRSLA
jgi:diamine N-acetyltransferase